MYIDVLVFEIGSTTTLVNAFTGVESAHPEFLGQGVGATSVLEGDVRIGLNAAIEDLKAALHADSIDYGAAYATSSAAGGLKMSVHGLVYDMTVNAARAAALGAGAVIKLATAGKLTPPDIFDIRSCRPNLIMIAGGTDYGERETAYYNARVIADMGLDVPVIYAGNVQNRTAVKTIFEDAGIPVYLTENVYPRLDELNIEPARRVIHAVFEEHIVRSPGMEHIRDTVSGSIMPTPGAVMEAARLLYEDIGDLAVIDVGGATTDVHSATGGSDEIAAISVSPEPFFKRTVEGDLGLFVNAKNVFDQIGADALSHELGFDAQSALDTLTPVPKTPEHIALAERLCLEAGVTAINRHAGRLRYIYTPSGRQTVAEGKDLSRIKYIVATGGALTRLPHRQKLLRAIADCNKTKLMLYPREGEAELLFDTDYIMASLGVLSKHYKEAALTLLRKSLKLEEN